MKEQNPNKYSQKQELSKPIGQLLQQAGLITGKQVE